MAATRILVNGEARTLEADPDTPLLTVLRDDLALTGTKYGCGEGQCGACTVLVDGQAIRSCVTRVTAVADRSITTIEGLAPTDALHAVQRAFVDVDAFQCGYCTPGMVLGAVALLAAHPDPDDATIRRLMNAHVCRCGEYSRIVAAVRRAARTARETSGVEP
jgi:aerobic-type carbon monoxide dehydrogenase small subunit (CoxS/CutS family)